MTALRNQIPSSLQLVESTETNVTIGKSFTIAWTNADATVVAVPAQGGDATVSLSILANTPCPVLLKKIVSTTANIIIGY